MGVHQKIHKFAKPPMLEVVACAQAQASERLCPLLEVVVRPWHRCTSRCRKSYEGARSVVTTEKTFSKQRRWFYHWRMDGGDGFDRRVEMNLEQSGPR
jgi:hypothetical protein